MGRRFFGSVGFYVKKVLGLVFEGFRRCVEGFDRFLSRLFVSFCRVFEGFLRFSQGFQTSFDFFRFAHLEYGRSNSSFSLRMVHAKQ